MKMMSGKWIVVLGLTAGLAWLSAGIAQEMEFPGDEVSFEISPMVEPGEGEIFEAPQDVDQPQEVPAEPAPVVEAPEPAAATPAPAAQPEIPAAQQTVTALPGEQDSDQDVDAQPSPSDIVVAPSDEPAPAPAAPVADSVIVDSSPVMVGSSTGCCTPACARPVRVRTIRRSCCDPCGRRVRFIRRCR